VINKDILVEYTRRISQLFIVAGGKMAKRIKKPPVELGKRQDWLKRYELGESPPHIAQTDSFDVRTVRTHIELAKQEREVKENRGMVSRNAMERHYSDLGNAMERHYSDLCEYAEKLSALAHGENAAESSREEYILSALRQHLPRSPIWNYLKQREDLNQQIDQLRQQAAKKLEEEVKSASQLSSRPDLSEIVALGMIDLLKFQLDKWAQGHQGLNIKDSLSEQSAGGLVDLYYGVFHLGNIKGKDVALIKEVLYDLEPRIRQLEEYKKLEKLYAELKHVENDLEEELAVITLRRIVPGRCRYCPL
jgi:cell fate (sporulation/competence/biofilm development) regulator YlbF (YheA/YmcA/DUF963 family)